MKSKEKLDKLINKSRVHFYKPIQIAEILYKHRTKGGFDLSDLESYRNSSKRWRDAVTQRLVGRVSTSSQKFQDNIFEANALPPEDIKQLSLVNEKEGGSIEAYIYESFADKLGSVYEIFDYIDNSDTDTFKLSNLIGMFTKDSGLKRSIDKMYEIAVYALFSSIVRELQVQVTLAINNQDKDILEDFDNFINLVLGLNKDIHSLSFPARLYRVGVTNAADRGLDMWANFGPAIRIKHLTLTPELLEDVVDEVSSDKVIIVCVDKEKEAINALLMQVGWADRVQGIITLSDLDNWYSLCLSARYVDRLGGTLLADIKREFNDEFPSISEIMPFMKERGYNKFK